MLGKHIKPFLEWRSPEVNRHVPFLAALAVGIPVVAGVLFHEPRHGMLAATGAMVILYLPQTLRSLPGKMLRLILCSFGFVASYALGALAAFHPAASVLLLGLLTLLATTVCRANKVPPPGSFFFVLIASVACNAPFDLATLPLRVGLVAMGGLSSCVVAFVYGVLTLRSQPPREAVAKDSRLSAILVEASVIAFFVALSLLVARFLKLENPYWVPVSCAAILQGGTFRAVWHRNIHRIVGTALGMAVSWWVWPRVADPVLMAVIIVALVFVVESLVPRHYGLAVIFITPLTVAFVEFATGGVPVHGLLVVRLMDIVIGSVIGAAGGWVLHHPQWCGRVEEQINRLRRRIPSGRSAGGA